MPSPPILGLEPVCQFFLVNSKIVVRTMGQQERRYDRIGASQLLQSLLVHFLSRKCSALKRSGSLGAVARDSHAVLSLRTRAETVRAAATLEPRDQQNRPVRPADTGT
jgi:hypothetical protein